MHHDLYLETTRRIVAAIESGSTLPWVKPWSTINATPRNAVTQRAYRGINTLLLLIAADARDFRQSRWMTFRQAAELGGHVRAGEHGVRIVFFKQHAFREAIPGGTETRSFPVLRSFTVFNVAQIGGLPKAYLDVPTAATWDSVEAAEALMTSSGAEIHHGSTHAYYSRPADAIHLPHKHAFADRGGYYETALHELIHWTGHASRCNRNLKGRFGDEAYAMEELIAELGCSYLCAHCRVDGRLQHTAYVSSWLRVLQNDKRAIFTAASRAQQAADYLLPATEMASDVREAA